MSAPNIVLIMADQLAPQFTGAYGHPIVKTPSIDALAGQGMRFDAAYTNSPLCAPSRFSFMSGQLVTRIAAYDNAAEFPATVPTFAHYLRMMGYKTCLAGKMHFVGPDQMHGFEERLNTDVYPADFAWTPDWEMPDERIDEWYHNLDAVREAGMGVTTFQLEYDEEVGFSARRKLMEYATKEQSPFCLVASFINPHDPYVARPEWWNAYDHDSIDMPAFTLKPEEQDAFSRRLLEGIDVDGRSVTDAEIRNARHGYYANVSYFDSKVGEIVRTLEEIEQRDNTIVIVTSDHGEMLGERGLWYKMNFFEHSGRVPLIMSGPGIAKGAVGSPCSLVDILPTMIDIGAVAGLPRPPVEYPVDGRSLWGMASTGKEDNGDAIGEYCAEMAGRPVFMIRRSKYKYMHCDGDLPMLFDLTTDPQEKNNLVDDPSHADVAADFAAEIKERWDSETITADVIAKQKQRRAVHNAMIKGDLTSWDFNPQRDAANEYIRNHLPLEPATQGTRFPRFKGRN